MLQPSRPLEAHRRRANTARKGYGRSSGSHGARLHVVAFKENEYIKDWRTKQMVGTCHTYYASVWSRGDMRQLDSLLDPAFVRRDLCSAAGWGASGSGGGNGCGGGGGEVAMVVGPRAFRALVEDMRRQHPDYYITVDEIAVSDAHRLYVSWTSHGTQLGAPDPWVATHAYTPHHAAGNGHAHAGTASTTVANNITDSNNRKHSHNHIHDHGHNHPKHVYGEKRPLFAPASPLYAHAGGLDTDGGHGAGAGASAVSPADPPVPSCHTSLLHGVDVITFNKDRSRLLEVNVFRQLSSDERRQVERRLAPHPLEIRLARLHWD